MQNKAGMEKIHKANQLLIDAKYILIETLELAETMEEKIDIAKVQACVQAGIKVILKTFYPKEEFDEAKWLKRRTSKDIEHNARVQKILDDAVATGAFDDKDSDDPDSPNYRKHPQDYLFGDDGHELITGK